MTTKICKKCGIVWYPLEGMPLPRHLNYWDVANCDHQFEEMLEKQTNETKICKKCNLIQYPNGDMPLREDNALWSKLTCAHDWVLQTQKPLVTRKNPNKKEKELNMPIKFISEIPEQKQPTFKDVTENQFFVNKEGYLCQKVDNLFCNVVAQPDGTPFAAQKDFNASDESIQKIISKITKIEF